MDTGTWAGGEGDAFLWGSDKKGVWIAPERGGTIYISAKLLQEMLLRYK